MCALGCSNIEDLLKWYNTFTAHPEVVGLSKEAMKNLTTPIQPLGMPGLNASFGQGIVATGNKNITNKVCSSADAVSGSGKSVLPAEDVRAAKCVLSIPRGSTLTCFPRCCHRWSECVLTVYRP